MSRLTFEELSAYVQSLNVEQQELPECVAPAANAIRAGRLNARWADLSEDRLRNLAATVTGEGQTIYIVDSQHLSWIGTDETTPAWIKAFIEAHCDARARLTAVLAIASFYREVYRLVRQVDDGAERRHVQGRYEPSKGWTLALVSGYSAGGWGYDLGDIDYIRGHGDKQIITLAREALDWERTRQLGAA